MSWYLSAMPRQWMRRIIFTKRAKVSSAQEHWFAADIAADCWRVDDSLYLCGENIVPQPKMLQGFTFLQEVDGIEQLCWEKAKNINCFFSGCASLEQLDLKNLNLSQIEDFSEMFSGCSKLKQLNFSGCKLGKAKNMRSMFEACLSLEQIDLTGWNVGTVKDLSRMFLECNHLKSLDVSNWDVSQVKNFSHMFSCCYNLKQLNVSSWNTVSAQNMKAMFNRCYALQEVDVSAWNTAQVDDFSKLFHQCRNLKKLDISHFKIKKNVSLKWMFVACPAKIKLPRDRRFRTLKESDRWFKDSVKSSSLHYVSWIRLEKDLLDMSYGSQYPADELDSGSLVCVSRGEGLILWSRFGKIYANKNSSHAFTIPDNQGRSWLREIRGLQLLDTRYAEDLQAMFAGNGSIMTLDVGTFDLRNAQDISAMFLACKSLSALDVSAWNTEKVKNMACLFDGCQWLRHLDVSKWNVGQVTDTRAMFRDCKLLRTLDMSLWNSSNLKESDAMFDGCEYLTANRK